MRALLLFLVLLVAAPTLAKDTHRLKSPFSQGSCVVAKVIKERNETTNHVLIATVHHNLRFHGVTMPCGYTITYPDGSTCDDVKLVAVDTEHDLAILQAWAPKSITPPEFAAAVAGRKSVATGFPGTEILFEVEGDVILSTPAYAICNQMVIQGMSGGGVFQDGKLIGLNIGGMKWIRDMDFDPSNDDTPGPRTTFPNLICSTESISRLLKSYLESDEFRENNVDSCCNPS